MSGISARRSASAAPCCPSFCVAPPSCVGQILCALDPPNSLVNYASFFHLAGSPKTLVICPPHSWISVGVRASKGLNAIAVCSFSNSMGPCCLSRKNVLQIQCSGPSAEPIACASLFVQIRSWCLLFFTCTSERRNASRSYICRVQDYWHGYKLFCYGFYSRSARHEAEF